MRLSVKMILLYSVIIAVAIGAFSSYAVQTSVDGASNFSATRFSNMSTGISLDIQQSMELMDITLETLVENTTFLSALNQYVRDDTDEGKMAQAARTAALQQLYQSPLVDRYYCVAFFNETGHFFSSTVNKDSVPPDFGALLERLSPYSSKFVLPPYQNLLTLDPRTQVYGLVEPVYFHGKLLGYLAALSECSNLDHILTFVDNSEKVTVQVYFDDGTLFYSSRDAAPRFPLALECGHMVNWKSPDNDVTYEVMHTRIESLGLHLFLAQDSLLTVQRNASIMKNVLRQAVIITVPAIILITLLSLGLTRSIRRLTQKVRQMPANGILLNSPAALEPLNKTVTSAQDTEIHQLELAYNQMMHRLRENAINELALREGTLQAQLSALQAQINPHFIYNTLNIISAKSMESGNLEIIEICSQFASMLRYSTDTRSRTATLGEEIDNVQNYLLLAKARYEENLEYLIEVPRTLYGIEVPKLTLQPLVENALNHGFDGKNILRRLSIIGTCAGKELTLTIRDNGIGFTDEMLTSLQRRIAEVEAGRISIQESGGHIGLVNTCLRLHYYSKGTMHMTIHNDNGAVITLTMLIR